MQVVLTSFIFPGKYRAGLLASASVNFYCCGEEHPLVLGLTPSGKRFSVHLCNFGFWNLRFNRPICFRVLIFDCPDVFASLRCVLFTSFLFCSVNFFLEFRGNIGKFVKATLNMKYRVNVPPLSANSHLFLRITPSVRMHNLDQCAKSRVVLFGPGRFIQQFDKAI